MISEKTIIVAVNCCFPDAVYGHCQDTVRHNRWMQLCLSRMTDMISSDIAGGFAYRLALPGWSVETSPFLSAITGGLWSSMFRGCEDREQKADRGTRTRHSDYGGGGLDAGCCQC